MKKKIRIILILISVLIVLLFPIKSTIWDGGTIEYRSLLYRVIKWHKLDNYYESGYKTGTEIYIFPFNLRPIDYYDKPKPSRLYISKDDKWYSSEVISYCWKNEYRKDCFDNEGILNTKYKFIIKVNKNEEFIYEPNDIVINSINLYNDKGIVDYQVEFDSKLKKIKVPNLSGIYYLEMLYETDEGNAKYAFKLDIN